MLLRLLLLIAMLGHITGEDARTPEERKRGGESFGTIINLVAGLGVIVLLVLIALAIMAMAGRFDMAPFDPVT